MQIVNIEKVWNFLQDTPNPQKLPKDWHVTPNFGWWEFFKNETDKPSFSVLINICLLAGRLQVLRDTVFEKPITITSGWRSPIRNAKLIAEYESIVKSGKKPTFNKPAKNSQHLTGCAVDIVVQDYTQKEVQRILQHWYGGRGDNSPFNYVHLDIRPKKEYYSYV